MDLEQDLQLFMEWIRGHLIQNFIEVSGDLYTDDYDTYLERLLQCSSNMRQMVQDNDRESYLEFKKEYVEIFSMINMQVVSDEIADITQDMADAEDESKEEFSWLLLESMAKEFAGAISYPHSYWASHLTGDDPVIYNSKAAENTDIKILNNAFKRRISHGQHYVGKRSHTFNCYNSILDFDLGISKSSGRNPRRRERPTTVENNPLSSRPNPRHPSDTCINQRSPSPYYTDFSSN